MFAQQRHYFTTVARPAMHSAILDVFPNLDIEKFLMFASVNIENLSGCCAPERIHGL